MIYNTDKIANGLMEKNKALAFFRKGETGWQE